MVKETAGIVIAASKQWWLKVNTKPVRRHSVDGAVFPYIIRVKYTVNGKDYIKRKWIHAGDVVPGIGSARLVRYQEDKPSKAKII